MYSIPAVVTNGLSMSNLIFSPTAKVPLACISVDWIEVHPPVGDGTLLVLISILHGKSVSVVTITSAPPASITVMCAWQSRPMLVMVGLAVRLTVVVFVAAWTNVSTSPPIVIVPAQSVWLVTLDSVTLHLPVMPVGHVPIVGEATIVPSKRDAIVLVHLLAKCRNRDN